MYPIWELRYVIFRINYLIKTKIGWQKRTFPTNPDFKKHISFIDWKDNAPPFFFYGKEIKGLKRQPAEGLKENIEDLKKRGLYFFLIKLKLI